MKIHVIGTGSKGNAYLLKADTGEILMIECGVNFNDIKKALNYDYSRVVGNIVTHQHLDHCKAAKEVCAAGIDIYCLKETSDSFKFRSHRVNNFLPQKQFTLGEFKILPFSVSHDVPCVGFLIFHPECGRTLFVTDSYYVQYKFNDLNNVIIEANYCEKILEQRKVAGSIYPFLTDRIIKSHMSLQTCMGVLEANDLKSVWQVILIHLSDRNSDGESFKKQINQLTGRTVHVAHKGMELSFNKSPF